MTSPAPVVVQPDAEAWVIANLRHLRGVTAFAFTAAQVWPGWVYSHSVQVDARAKSKSRARDLAESARQVVCSLPDREWPDGVVAYVQPVEGPFWLPDDDGLPRYCTRYEIRVHPRRRNAPAATPAAASRPPGPATSASPGRR